MRFIPTPKGLLLTVSICFFSGNQLTYDLICASHGATNFLLLLITTTVIVSKSILSHEFHHTPLQIKSVFGRAVCSYGLPFLVGKPLELVVGIVAQFSQSDTPAL